MVQRHCRAQARVRDCYSTVRAAEDGVSIGIRLHVLPDTDAVKLTEELQQSLKDLYREPDGRARAQHGHPRGEHETPRPPAAYPAWSKEPV